MAFRKTKIANNYIYFYPLHLMKQVDKFPNLHYYNRAQIPSSPRPLTHVVESAPSFRASPRSSVGLTCPCLPRPRTRPSRRSRNGLGEIQGRERKSVIEAADDAEAGGERAGPVEADTQEEEGRGEWPTPSSAMALERAEFSWPHFGQVGEALAGSGRGKERIE